jgi:hypothetical protein
MWKPKDPSRELATKILTEVGFEDRLTGFILRERSGPRPAIMYRFEEVVSLLNDPHPRLDFSELERWVRETMGDTELAGEIAVAVRSEPSDQDRSLRIKKLMEQRLDQCKRLI